VIAKSGILLQRGTKSKIAQKRDLTKLSNTELLDLTLSGSGWHQEQARRVLRIRDKNKVFTDAKAWLDMQADPRAQLEVAWLHVAFDERAPNLDALLASKDTQVRAAAACLLVQSH